MRWRGFISDNNWNEKDYYGSVDYRPGFFTINDSPSNTLYWGNSYEVVGNIYENPELLEESNGKAS